MATKIKLGNGNWGVKENGLLAYNDEDNVFKAIEMDFSRAGTATRESSAGLITDSPIDTPRIDFSDTSDGALLLEPQSTNLFTYSEDFSNGSWLKSIAVVTLTSEIAPDGTNDSVYNFVGASANLYTNTQSAGLDYTISFYIKSNGNGKDVFKLRLGSDFSQVFTATNEWVRYTFSATPSTQVFGISSNGIDSDILIWGAQLEEQSYATSYIKTEGATATRIAESCSKTGLGNYINSSEGVLYVEMSGLSPSIGNKVISINDGSNTNAFWLYIISNSSGIRIFDGNTIGSFFGGTAYENTKYALVYNSTNTRLFVNGALAITIPFKSMSNLNTLSFSDGSGSQIFEGKVKDLRVYDQALSDEELQTLTTL